MMLVDDLVRALGERGRGRRTRPLCRGIYLSLGFEDSVLLHCHTAPFPRIEATISPFRRSLPSPARCRSVTPRSHIFAALVAVRHSAEFHIRVMHACSLRKRKWSCEGITRPYGSFADFCLHIKNFSAKCPRLVLRNNCFVFLLQTQ